MSDPTPTISVCVAGWSYPDWTGFVYDRSVRDPLQFLAGYVDMIEINNTFYRPPVARNAESWVKRTAMYPEFFFSAKLHQEVTHEGVLSPGMARMFKEGLAPMTERGTLRHLLAQFRYDFADGPEHRALLRGVREQYDGLGRTVFELRHKSWEAPEALAFLEGLDVAVANLDYPVGNDSFALEECRVGRDGYLRLHGRNAAAWFSREAGRDQTYNYYYTKKEREHLAARAISLARTFRSLTIVANNHYEGKEVANALQLKAAIAGRKVAVPPTLLGRYAELKDVADEKSLEASRASETPTLF